MHTIRDDRVEVTVSDDGVQVALANLKTGSRWVLDPDSTLADDTGKRVEFAVGDGSQACRWEKEAGEVQVLGDRALLVARRGPAGQAALRYEICADGCRVTLVSALTTATSAALPGALRPEGVDSTPVVLPKNQGVWHKGTGAPFRFNMVREGHGGFTMPLFGVVGRSDALLTVIEEEHDARIWFEKANDGRVIAAAVVDPSLGRIRYDRSVLLRFAEPDVTSICASYRDYVKTRGRLVTWDEKISERPNLERLFGALMCFIGYCRDDTTDYAASFKRLASMGFDRAFVYPLAFGNIVEGFEMGGRPPIDIRKHLGLLDELGYLSAAWMWTEDVPEDPRYAVIDEEGNAVFGWQIDEMKWFRGCPVAQVPLSNQIQNERMAGFTAHHFDVTASKHCVECYNPDHPLDRREDALWRTKVLRTGTGRGLVVSSEGFWGYACGDYDIGSVKIALPVHPDWYTVPMTSLVYHDSLVHDWWEIDNYNNPRHRNQGGRDKAYFPLGGGWARLQAAQDALAGWPPNVFPFGAQYAFVEGEMFKGTELYRFDLDDPAVKEALEHALPVARLHRRVGKLACIAHETFDGDGCLQATTFADGTRVAANFSDKPAEIPGFGLVESRSWQAS
ncbi:MAG: hypothetical protein ACYTAN_10630 [Planctomycetota bacterium]